MDEILRYFANNGIRDGAAGRLRLLVYVCGKVFDELAGRGGLYLRHMRRAEQIVVQRDARDGIHMCVVEWLIRAVFILC